MKNILIEFGILSKFSKKDMPWWNDITFAKIATSLFEGGVSMIKQMTLRRIPADVEKALRNRANECGISLNKLSIELLSQALGVDQLKKKRRDLSVFCGAWSEENFKEFEENTKLFESIDPEVWS